VLYYKTFVSENNSEWITFIHGAGGSSSIWFKQIKNFKSYFNLLLIDLKGHGKSKNIDLNDGDNLDTTNIQIIGVLDYLKINKSHFVGVSLGTILMLKLAKTHAHRINKMIMCGAITSFNKRTVILYNLANFLKNIITPISLYKLFAYIMMPRNNHRDSRLLFVKEAKKIKIKTFRKWLALLNEVKSTVEDLSKINYEIPTLFISGKEDHMFVKKVEKFVSENKNCLLEKISKCGHVVNINKPYVFNKLSLSFLIENDEKSKSASV
tara:strand:+ start:2916 stop:3713 length:798 start_codon:yes stop_codon:yes gene_type:complete